MGYMTKLVRKILLDTLSMIACDADLAQKHDNNSTAADNDNNHDDRTIGTTGTGSARSFLGSWSAASLYAASVGSNITRSSETARDDPNNNSNRKQRNVPYNVIRILYISTLFDILDAINLSLDLILIVRLFRVDGTQLYAGLLLAGLILGRLVDYRGSELLFRYGLNWNPFWIVPEHYSNDRVFHILYCLLFTEAAIFLLEDYPSLVVYDHWMVLAFPPPDLEMLDDINVVFSTISMALLHSIFLMAILVSLYLLIKHEWQHWSKATIRIKNIFKIAVFLTALFFLSRFVLTMLLSAMRIVFDEPRILPSNKICGIEICDQVTFAERREYCDERIFIIRVAGAWFAASIFTAYLIFSPATVGTIVIVQEQLEIYDETP
eukprot:CAMPEP_0198141102 /NCGR_PEP_ID=MMETSP1443-20131203/4167_1 /TAXON_ID=186043 /ORGANISM="Entomoneis sp., Strain CCMP2396" /LENGTH=378 /DNA_ID=CAMNT_0043803739 /DNA_START=219 /DNA_END=1352 /DNA_ORIENTATION=-